MEVIRGGAGFWFPTTRFQHEDKSKGLVPAMGIFPKGSFFSFCKGRAPAEAVKFPKNARAVRPFYKSRGGDFFLCPFFDAVYDYLSFWREGDLPGQSFFQARDFFKLFGSILQPLNTSHAGPAYFRSKKGSKTKAPERDYLSSPFYRGIFKESLGKPRLFDNFFYVMNESKEEKKIREKANVRKNR